MKAASLRISKPADLARLVKTRRHAHGRTQQDVADAVGITRQSLARVERGNAGISFDTLILIFDYLGIRLDATPDEGLRVGAGLTQGIDTAAFTQAALRQLQPSRDEVGDDQLA